MNGKYERAANYRTIFINIWPPKDGEYRCVYCGRKISVSEMEVDHIVSVNRVKRNRFYRLCVPKGINDISNLVPSCQSCNRRKGNKGGLWAIRGRYWKLCLPIYLIFLLIASVSAILFAILVILIALQYEPAIKLTAALFLSFTQFGF